MARRVMLDVPVDHPSFAGHFPGQPLLPGVVLLGEAMTAILADGEARAVLGETPRIGAVKFLSPVRPGGQLRIEWEVTGRRVRFEVHAHHDADERLAAAGQLEAAA